MSLGVGKPTLVVQAQAEPSLTSHLDESVRLFGGAPAKTMAAELCGKTTEKDLTLGDIGRGGRRENDWGTGFFFLLFFVAQFT